jgi:hypothetical protein
MMRLSPKGRATRVRAKPVTTKYGAMRKMSESASAGTRSSLKSSFTASASHCRKPAAPTRLGPMRLCMRPATRRSSQEKMPPKMAPKLKSTNATAARASA